MQDAQYGAVSTPPPPPPKRVGRKAVVALAALGLAGVAALSLGPAKKTATGLVVKYTGESRGKGDGCEWLDILCPGFCAANRNNYNTKRQERVPATIDFSVRSLPRRRAALSVYIIRLKILKHEPRRRKHNSRFGAIPPRPAPA